MAKKRKNGQGTVYHRKDGRWEGRHIVGYDENGKAITKNVLAKTKLACIEKLKKLQTEYADVAPSKIKSEMRFGDWMHYWYENHSKPTIRPSTQKGYEALINGHAIPGLGQMLIASIGNRDYPVVQAIIVIVAALVVLCNFLADILYRVMDPRLKGR